jgi:hypothetical protein
MRRRLDAIGISIDDMQQSKYLSECGSIGENAKVCCQVFII